MTWSNDSCRYPAADGILQRVDRWPTVGRDSDLRILRASLLSPSFGSAALVGPPGIGKTHLAADLAQEAQERGFVVLHSIAGESTQQFPFAALAAVLPPLGDQRDAAALFQQVRADWTRDHGTRPVLLLVDDCHLLDSGSAALVQQLVNARVCRLLATVRSDHPLPDAIDSLWRSSRLEIVDLDPLDVEGVHRLLEEILGPPVSLSMTQRLLRRTEGNPLYLREMVRAALVDETLTKVSGMWEVRSGDTTSMRLADIVRRRIGRLSPEAMRVLEILAVAGVVSESDLTAMLDDPPMEELEQRGLIVLDQSGRRSQVRLGHPVFGEILRADSPVTRQRRLRARLAQRIEECGARRQDDILHLVAWLDDADRRPTADQLVRASKRAQALFDLRLAKRLAQQAVSAGGGTAAAIALAEAEFRTGDVSSALEVLASAAREAVSDEDIAGVADTRAHVLCLAGRSAQAFEVLEAARRQVCPEAAVQIAGRTAVLMIQNAGRPREALIAVDELQAAHGGRREDMPLKVRMRADYVATLALPLVGRSAQSLAISQAFADWLAADAEVPIPAEQALIGAAIAHLLAGDLPAAASDAEQLEKAMVRIGDLEGEATGALLRARVLIARGELVAARRFLDRALAINEDLADHIGIRWSLGGIALASGLAGDRASARVVAGRILADEIEPAGFFEPDLVQRGLAWAAVANGEPTRARELLESAAQAAEALGQTVPVWQLRHDLMRLGERPSDALRSAGGSAWADTVSQHACALVVRDPVTLSTAAERWAELGFLIEAVEATATAADLFAKAGQNRRATAASVRFDELRKQCDQARTPGLLRPAGVAVSLTRREREIANLAIQNLTAATIAERLILSRRTVENHLQRVYTKLGVSSRAELESALRGLPD